MAKKGLLSLDTARRSKTIFHAEDGKHYVETRQDVGALADAAKILAETPPDKETGLRFVCFIDDATLQRAMTEGWMHDKDAWRRWAKDNKALNGNRSNPF